MERIVKLLQYSALIFICSFRANGQALPRCSDQAVEYRSAPTEIEDKIAVERSDLPQAAPPDSKRVLSPQGTRWLIEVDPDYSSTKFPWNTMLYVGTPADARVALRVSIKDHGNTFSTHWINEKLLFIQVWWGRFASSDLILDVSKGYFLYDEFAHYGGPGQACTSNK